ncbi:hypothetical protein NE237_011928 [Protea cynaroides]|uniref:Pectinesterase inhibitor domain-containing protein n=1 Tax=Protea cynaroides TaxID=273540 RepID=A0A9Q0JYD7_9MAGN|nr:hypothetical protein NE237_011928 [Protea cynaroides]
MGLDNHQVLIVSLSSLLFFLNALPPFAASFPITTLPSPGSVRNLLQFDPITNPISNLANTVVDSAIHNICHATDYPDLCISSLKPYLNGKTDLITILEYEIKACKDRTIAASAEILREIQNPNTDPKTKPYLKDCNELYGDALDNLQKAEDAMKINDIGTINSMLSAALSDFDTCHDGFSEIPGLQPPISGEEINLKHLASNCLAIASLIKW